jgi:hypothetical protein
LTASSIDSAVLAIVEMPPITPKTAPIITLPLIIELIIKKIKTVIPPVSNIAIPPKNCRKWGIYTKHAEKFTPTFKAT